MKKAFISYRRQDSPGHVRALHDRLRQHFHPDQVFMDVEDIPLGTDFVTVLDKNLSDCVVMIVMIGPEWLDIRRHDGSRRLDNPHDFVRLEISQALKRNISVIPILVDGAPMPTEAELPADLKPLSRRQALAIDNKHYDYGINTLTRELEKHLGKPTPVPVLPSPPEHKEKSHLPLMLGLAAVLGCVVVLLALFLFSRPGNDKPQRPQQTAQTSQQTTVTPNNNNGQAAVNRSMNGPVSTTIPTASAGFNCSQATNDVEDTICNSDRTRKADQHLNQIYQKLALSIPPAAQQSLRRRQLNWVQQRNTHIRQHCLTQANQGLITQCVANYYQQRISALSRLPVSLLSRVRVVDPPTNIRRQPNGDIICQVSSKQMIEVYTDSVRERDGDRWYWTRFCGDTRWGVVHESQISRVN